MNKPLSKFKQRKLKAIEALESGKYKQGTGTLRRDDKFCCLGVICDIHRIEQDDYKAYHWETGCSSLSYREYLGAASTLPIKVSRWLGLPYGNYGTFQIKSRHVEEVLSEEEIDDLTGGCGLDFDSRNSKIGIMKINDSGIPFKKIARLMRLQFNLPKED